MSWITRCSCGNIQLVWDKLVTHNLHTSHCQYNYTSKICTNVTQHLTTLQVIGQKRETESTHNIEINYQRIGRSTEQCTP